MRTGLVLEDREDDECLVEIGAVIAPFVEASWSYSRRETGTYGGEFFMPGDVAVRERGGVLS